MAHDLARPHEHATGSADDTTPSAGKRARTERIQRKAAPVEAAPTAAAAPAPRWDDPALAIGVSYLASVLDAPVQRRADGPASDDVHALAAHGTAGAGEPLPFLDRIQAAFGDHDLRGVVAHTGDAAAEAATGMGATAFATGNHVAFAGAPDLHTAAHEAAHVVQQRAGVHLKGGVGEAGDVYERQADAVADRVVAGESAADLLGPVAGGGAARAAVQRDARPDAHADGDVDVTELPELQAGKLIEPGENAALAFKHAVELGEKAYVILLRQASAKAIHKQVEEDQAKAKKAYEKSQQKSAMSQILGAITAIAAIATGIGGLIGAAEALYEAQSALKAAKALKVKGGKRARQAGEVAKEAAITAGKEARGKALGDGKDAGSKVKEGAGGLGGESKADTMLFDANAAAIKAGNDAADALMEEHSRLQLLLVGQKGETAELGIRQMNRSMEAMKRQHQVLPDEIAGQHKALVAKLKKGQADFEAVMFKLKHLWGAYDDHGHEALQSSTERPIFETLMEWKRTHDPRLKKVEIAMDQEMKRVKFTGLEIDSTGTGRLITRTLAYAYTESLEQLERGLIYVSDPAVAKALGLYAPAPVNPMMGPGVSEQHEDAHGKGTKYAVSISLCKSLESLGVLDGKVTRATITLEYAGSTMAVKERHKGDAYEHWMDTDTFGEFWKKHLGGEYGFIWKMDKKSSPKTFAAATDAARARSVSKMENPGAKRHGEG